MATSTKYCDFLVIGGGSGGLASAKRASGRYGAKVIVSMRDAKAYGFSVEQRAPFDRASFKAKQDAVIKNLNNIHERNLEHDGVEYIHGRARLVGKNEYMIKLDDGTEISINAKRILLATGGHPTIPQGIPGAEHGINSDGFFELDH
ncbi:glutathione reductase [Fusarium napiforme]|uniref:Glutathione reductase n=1 Tax=Fusarium napiforme TaxID=42672 RepID=A0A8H5MHJ7_9HYPO|nr:glutathione reductase [Fusarium napiforme]